MSNQGDNSKSISFSAQQIELFTTSYENKYDIYNSDDYVTWLAGYHPDALLDYVNLQDSAPQHRSDPFQPFEYYDQVGDGQNDGEVVLVTWKLGTMEHLNPTTTNPVTRH